MHKQDSQKHHPEWIINANNIIAAQTNKKFYAKDSCGLGIVIEWEQINAKSPNLSEKIKFLSQLLIDSYTKIELQFAKKHPECIKSEMFLSSLEPLLSQGIENIDWNLAEQQIRETLTKFFVETDWTKFSDTNDIYLFATAKDVKTNALLGIIQFMITTEYEYGTVKIALYDGVMPLEPQRKINNLLISSIFKILPITERLFFHTRITNTESIDNHQILGFTKFSGMLPNWTDLEYKITQSNQLQAIANTFQNTSSDKIKGACSCGLVNFEIDSRAIVKTVNCHCSLCRKMNGSAFSSYIAIKESGYKLINGQDNIANYKRSQNATKSFCCNCGTPIYNSNHTQYPGLKILYLGTLDNADQINIDANIFCDTQLAWVKQITKIHSFKQTTHSELIND